MNMKQSTILPMDCVREILTFLSPVKDTQGLHKYGYSEIPTYPYITQFTDLVDDAYERYTSSVEEINDIAESWTEGDYYYNSGGMNCLEKEDFFKQPRYWLQFSNIWKKKEEENIHEPTFVDSSDDEDSDGE